MRDLKKWRELIALSFAEALGQEGRPLPSTAFAVGQLASVPALTVQAGADGQYVGEPDEGTFCHSIAYFTVWVFVGKPFGQAVADDTDVYIERIPLAEQKFVDNSENVSRVQLGVSGVSEPSIIEIGSKQVLGFSIELELQLPH